MMNRLFKSLLMLGVSAGLCLASPPIEPNPEARWWKGNLHTHTFWSDGDDFPEMVAEWYREHEYNFLAISDHNIMNSGDKWLRMSEVERRSKGHAFEKYLARFGRSWVQTRGEPGSDDHAVRLKPLIEYRTLLEERGRFLLLEAEEITGKAGNGKDIHMNATNVAESVGPQPGDTVKDAIRNNIAAVREQARRLGRSVLVHVNHPNYKWGVTAEDLASIVEEPFFEIWNGVETDRDPGDIDHPSTDEIWDIALTLRLSQQGAAPLFGIATDDSHDYHGTTTRALPGRAWIMVRSAYLSPEYLIESIKKGDFYASTGVVLKEVEYDEQSRRLSISIQPTDGETFTTRFIGSRKSINIVAKPRLDANGRVVDTTLDYSDSTNGTVGEVFAEVQGLNPSYALTGDELYVRAVIESSASPTVPSTEYPRKRAWTQPVGWR